MKRSFTFLAFFAFLFAMQVNAQIPQTINWQGIIQDANGNNLNGEHSVSVSLFDVATDGVALWTEIHNAVTITNGLADIVLGSVAPLNLPFDKQYWLEITVDNGTPLPRIKLSSVPYSLYSAKSNGVIINDSLVLKDAQGVTRMVLNPNTGTFAMMNKDTVWYSLSVNSPLRTTERQAGQLMMTSYTDEYGRHVSEESDLNTGDKRKKSILEHKNGLEIFTTEQYYNGRYVSTSEIVSSMANDDYSEKRQFYDEHGNEINKIETSVETINNIKTTRICNHMDGKIYYTGEKKESLKSKDYHEETLYYDDNGEVELKYVTDYNGKDATLRTRKYNNQGTLESDETLYIHSNGLTSCSPEYGKDYSSTTKQTEEGTSLKHSTLDKFYNQVRNPNGTGGYQVGVGNDNKTVNQGFTFDKFGGVQVNTSDGQSFIVQGSTGISNNLLVQGNSKTQGDQTIDGNQTIGDNQTIGGNQTIEGDLNVTGPKKFRITHPNDSTKYLQHAAIESNEVLNKYVGTITTGSDSLATVTLPSYFHDINTDFHYQLTVIGDFAQAIISKEIENGKFEIKTNKPNIKVSWEVTAKRNDAYLQAHPFQDVINK